MTKAESKYFNTAKRMDEAFLNLVERKDFDYITITEICREAGVNRSTFYLHYETVGDLLNECVENINQEFMLYFNETSTYFRQNVKSMPLEQLFFITPKYLIPYLTYISEHRTVFKVVLANPQTMQAENTYASLFGDILDQILERYEIPEKNRSYMLSFYIEGMMGIIKQWLLSDCKDSVDDVAQIMMNVIRR